MPAMRSPRRRPFGSFAARPSSTPRGMSATARATALLIDQNSGKEDLEDKEIDVLFVAKK